MSIDMLIRSVDPALMTRCRSVNRRYQHSPGFLLPLVLLGLSLGAILWWVVSPSRSTMRVFQTVMLLFLSSGVLGLYLHYRGNVEFELEIYPSLRGFALFWEALKGATPALAPATMAHLGLVGLAYSYHHPVLTERD